jgi:hypothetical protein
MSFEQLFLISVKNVDLQTGIQIIRSVTDPLVIETIRIRKRGGDRA